MFTNIYEVTFKLTYAEDSESDSLSVNLDEMEDGSENDDQLVTAIIISTAACTLPEFVSKLNDSKARVLEDIGYPPVDMDSEIVQVTDVSENYVIGMLPVPLSH